MLQPVAPKGPPDGVPTLGIGPNHFFFLVSALFGIARKNKNPIKTQYFVFAQPDSALEDAGPEQPKMRRETSKLTHP